MNHEHCDVCEKSDLIKEVEYGLASAESVEQSLVVLDTKTVTEVLKLAKIGLQSLGKGHTPWPKTPESRL
jgi:hypothetical protein